MVGQGWFWLQIVHHKYHILDFGNHREIEEKQIFYSDIFSHQGGEVIGLIDKMQVFLVFLQGFQENFENKEYRRSHFRPFCTAQFTCLTYL